MTPSFLLLHPLGSQFCPNAAWLTQCNSIQFLCAQGPARSELRRVRGDAQAGLCWFLLCASPGLGPRVQIGTRHCPWKLEVKVWDGCRPGQGRHGRSGSRAGMEGTLTQLGQRSARQASWFGNTSAGSGQLLSGVFLAEGTGAEAQRRERGRKNTETLPPGLVLWVGAHSVTDADGGDGEMERGWTPKAQGTRQRSSHFLLWVMQRH